MFPTAFSASAWMAWHLGQKWVVVMVGRRTGGSSYWWVVLMVGRNGGSS